MKKLVILLLLFITTSSPLTAKVHAESSSLRVSPVKTEISISAGTSRNITIFIENVSANTKTINVDFRDTSVDTSGTRTLAPKGQTNSSDGTSSYTSGNLSFEIAAGQRQSYTATITVPANAESKTRYGGIAFTAAGDSGAVTSLVVATITSASAPTPSPSQSSTTSNSDSQTKPQTTSSAAPTTSQPTDTIKAGNSDDSKATVAANTRTNNKRQLWLGAGALSLLVALAGVYFLRHKRVATFNTSEMLATTTVAPNNTVDSEAATDSPKIQTPDQH